MKLKKVAIIGLGLIGGSLAWALKKSGQAADVIGIDSDPKAVDYAVRRGIINTGALEPKDSLANAEVIVIATHVGTIPKVVSTVSPLVPEGTIITDVGSVKGKIVREIEAGLPAGLHFIGGHPIAGTERSGISSADGELFKGKRCILTPTGRTDSDALSSVKGLWELVGAKVFTMDIDTHDRVFGFVSHLPHVVAYALLNSISEQGDADNMLDFAGGGLRDFTRIGESSADLWSDIFLMNKENTLEAIREFKKALEGIERAVEREELNGLKGELGQAVSVGRGIREKTKIS